MYVDGSHRSGYYIEHKLEQFIDIVEEFCNTVQTTIS